MTDRSDDFFADFDGMSRNSWSVNDAAEYARETQQWLRASLDPLKPIFGQGDKFAKDMEKSLGLLETSIDEYVGLIVTATEDSSAILLNTKETFNRGEDVNVDNVPDLDNRGGNGGGRR